MQQYTPTQLRELLDGTATSPFLLDVRERWEFDTCHLEGSVHIPMGEIPARLDEIPTDQTVVVICHHGVRSMRVAMFLQHNGFEDLVNLTGGVDRWARDIDPNMAVY